MIELTLTQDFPAGLDALWAAFGRADYPLRKYRALGALAVRIQRFDAGAKTIEVELERDVPVDPAKLPLWTRALVGRRQTLRHATVWRRIDAAQAAAELDISARGLPVRAHGVGSLVEHATGATRMVLRWEVRSPLGQRVERLFAQQIRAALAADHSYTVQELQQRAGDVTPADPRAPRPAGP